MKVGTNETRDLLLLVTIGLVVRVLIFPFAQTIDADAVTRTFLAYEWLQDPSLITCAVWPSLHLYFDAAAIWLTGSVDNGPRFMNMLFAVATAVPLYKFVRNEFNREGAFYVSLTYLFIPIVIRNSFQALSGIPYAFFVVLTMYLLSQGRKTGQQIKYGILAGLAITLASGFRYEAWLLIAVFTGVLFLQKQWKMMVAFMAFSMIFPLHWMTGCYLEKGEIFWGPNGSYRWNVILMGVNENMTPMKYLRRTFFFFVSWFFLLSPVVASLIAYFSWKNRRSGLVSRDTWLWGIPFVVLFLTFIYKALNGTLLLQHRFTLSLIFTSLPFYALMFADGKKLKLKRRVALAVVILLIPYSFLNRDIYSVPRLKDQNVTGLVELINQQTDDPQHQGLILDFIGWENTYYLSLKADIPPQNIVRVNGAKNGKFFLKPVREVLLKNPTGFLLKRNGETKLEQQFTMESDSVMALFQTKLKLKLEEIYSDPEKRVYKYSVMKTEENGKK